MMVPYTSAISPLCHLVWAGQRPPEAVLTPYYYVLNKPMSSGWRGRMGQGARSRTTHITSRSPPCTSKFANSNRPRASKRIRIMRRYDWPWRPRALLISFGAEWFRVEQKYIITVPWRCLPPHSLHSLRAIFFFSSR